MCRGWQAELRLFDDAAMGWSWTPLPVRRTPVPAARPSIVPGPSRSHVEPCGLLTFQTLDVVDGVVAPGRKREVSCYGNAPAFSS